MRHGKSDMPVPDPRIERPRDAITSSTASFPACRAAMSPIVAFLRGLDPVRFTPNLLVNGGMLVAGQEARHFDRQEIPVLVELNVDVNARPIRGELAKAVREFFDVTVAERGV